MAKADRTEVTHSAGRGPVVGLMLPTVANPDSGSVDPMRLLNAARNAEAAGFDGVYVGDHLLHPNPLLESITSLAAIAAVTKRVSLGSCVLLAALREPLWLAKQLGTLDAFAPGRLRVGIGLGGEYPAEFHQAGVPLVERGERTEEIVVHLRQWMSERQPDFGDGGMAMGIAPVPSSPPPFLFAGWKEAPLRRAARIGDGWIGYLLSPQSFSRRRQFLFDCGAGSERQFTTGMLLPVLIDAISASPRASASAEWNRITGNDSAFPEKLFVAGSPDEIVEQLHGYWQLGCTEMVLSLVDQGHGYDSQLDILASAVLPELRRFTSPVP